MFGDKKDSHAKKLSEIFQQIALTRGIKKSVERGVVLHKSEPAFTDMLDIRPEVEEYTGIFENELKSLIKKPLTLSNMKKELTLAKKHEKQINRIISKIFDSNSLLDTVSTLYTNMEYSEQLLSEYNNSAKFFSWLFDDKEYKSTKETHDVTKRILKDNYKIENKDQLNAFVKKFHRKNKLLDSLKNAYAKVSRKKQLLVFAIKGLSKKIKGNIASKHPELANYIEILTCEQAQDLKNLKEKYNFIPKDVSDFEREIKSCRNQIKKSDTNKSFLLKKIKLLENVYVGISGSASLNRLQKSLQRKIQGPLRDREREK